MTLSARALVGYLRAEFARTSKLRVWLFFLQFMAAAPGAISVVVTDVVATYVLAILSAIMLILWWVLNALYMKGRDAAQTARRAAVLLGGLGQNYSPAEISSLRDKMTVSPGAAQAFEKDDYYATKLAPGSARLGEMIEESAFYSSELQDASAKVMLYVILLFVLIFAIIAFAAIPFVENGTVITILRIFLATVVFAMSSDVLGAYLLHRNAVRSLNDVKARLKVARRDSFPLADVLLIVADYNSAIEAAPESVPFAYRLKEKSLNQRWAQYQIDNQSSQVRSV